MYLISRSYTLNYDQDNYQNTYYSICLSDESLLNWINISLLIDL